MLPSMRLSDNPIANNTSLSFSLLEEQALVVETITSSLENALTSTSPLTPGNAILTMCGAAFSGEFKYTPG